MQKTQNLNLNKPDYTDVADIADLNANMDIIDKAMLEHKHNAVEIMANTNLNDIDDEGDYWCTSSNSNSVKGKPDNVPFFNLRVSKISGGVFSQEITTSDNRKFIRIHWSGTWTEWTKFSTADDLDKKADTGHKHTKSDITDFPQSLKNPQALTISLNGASQGGYNGSAAKSINITAQSVGASSSNHTHSLTGTDLTGTLPVSKGGTGATTATAARTALGLGTAATRAYTTAVSSGSASLVTSGAVYSAINNLNINNRTHIVVATYNTKNPLKANADYTCTSSNASSVLKTAINAVANGGEVELLDGTYNLQYNEDAIEITKTVTIQGSDYNTVINQPADEYAGEAKPAFIISAQNVRLNRLMICDKNISSPVPIIKQQAQGAIYDDVFFIFNASEIGGGGGCVRGSGDCNFTRIQNCRVFKGFNNSDIVMFDFGECTSFGGVIGANISSGYDNISVLFANDEQKNNTAVYGHKAIDLMIKGAS